MPPIGEACLHGLQRVITGDNIKHFEVLLSDTEMTAGKLRHYHWRAETLTW